MIVNNLPFTGVLKYPGSSGSAHTPLRRIACWEDPLKCAGALLVREGRPMIEIPHHEIHGGNGALIFNMHSLSL